MFYLVAEVLCILLVAVGAGLAVSPGVGMMVAGVLFLGLVALAQMPDGGNES